MTTGQAGSIMMAVDVGSSRVKIGFFSSGDPCDKPLEKRQLSIVSRKYPEPEETLSVAHRNRSAEEWSREAAEWIEARAAGAPCECVFAAVDAGVAERLQLTLADRSGMACRQLSVNDVALDVRVRQPERVGVDRLMNAVAANSIRPIGRPAIVVDLGTAITVDLISQEGAFEGGAIVPGPAMAISALHQQTVSLPEL
ncbi:MAG: type III pantothenate kinase, partial [Planctomycetota bacterium]